MLALAFLPTQTFTPWSVSAICLHFDLRAIAGATETESHRPKPCFRGQRRFLSTYVAQKWIKTKRIRIKNNIRL